MKEYRIILSYIVQHAYYIYILQGLIHLDFLEKTIVFFKVKLICRWKKLANQLFEPQFLLITIFEYFLPQLVTHLILVPKLPGSC